MFDDDTIAAIATPIGVGGVGVVRVSGTKSLEILQKLIENKPKQIIPRYSFLGKIKNIDNVLYTYFKSPSSYTGEDTVEISCHGGVGVTKRILEKCIENGARQAKNGEFTKRAFLGGRLDLAQAESIISLINAKTGLAIEASAQQLAGGLSAKIKEAREALIGAIAKIEATIDFPDDITVNRGEIEKVIEEGIITINRLIEASKYGKIVSEGVMIAIIGKPNVGKSTLFNTLLKESRAIVTDEPGTTRDTIEETIDILGIPIRIIDTAGIRKAQNKAEEIGIERSKATIESAEIVILVLDGSVDRLEKEDNDLMALTSGKKTIVAINKSDRGEKLKVKGISISALSGKGIDGLENEIYKQITGGSAALEDSAMILNLRQKECLSRAIESLQKADKSFKIGAETELLTIDLRAAVEALGEVSGIGVSEEIINRIFDDFCIGK